VVCSWDGTPIEPEQQDYQAEYRAELAVRREQRLTKRPALCCVCGTIRLTSAHGGRLGNADGDDRCIVQRKCETCAIRTPHAYLLAHGTADCDEPHPYPDLDEATEAQLFELEVDEARAGGVKVSNATSSGPILVSVTQHLDDGEWAVFLDPEATARRRRFGLQTALRAIRDAKARKWFVVSPDPELDRPAVRFAVFADSQVEFSGARGSALASGTGVDPDGPEPPTPIR
jgi:hypothetical protein